MFVKPSEYDIEVTKDGTPTEWARKIYDVIFTFFNPQKPTALFIGRYQPFHDGHKALIIEGINRVGQACIAVRNTHGTDEKNPFDFNFVKSKIEEGLEEYLDKINIVQLPNITNVFYGRDVGYSIEQIQLSDELHSISATEIRKKMKESS